MIVVFVGPTIAAAEVRAIVDAECRPPAARGDVYRAARGAPRAIGIVDGSFARVPSVWHKEILWAMSRGVHVFGAGSMGALRAAELCSHGMEGVGAIFAAFRDGLLEDDDEVAVSHAGAEDGYRPLSEAMVNVRATLASARDRGVLDGEAHDALVAVAKALPYPDRCWPIILERATARGAMRDHLAALRDHLARGRVDQKRADALAMLRRMREVLGLDSGSDPGPKRVAYTFPHTDAWETLVRLVARDEAGR